MAARAEIHRLPLTIRFVTRKVRCDLDRRAAFERHTAHAFQTRVRRIGHAKGQRQIGTVYCMRLELFGQPVMGAVRFGNHQKARGVFVDPVDDARTFFTADAGQISAEMMQ